MAFAVEDSTSSDAIDALVPRAPPEQILPSIPEKPIASGSAVDGKKRALPWDEELSYVRYRSTGADPIQNGEEGSAKERLDEQQDDEEIRLCGVTCVEREHQTEAHPVD